VFFRTIFTAIIFYLVYYFLNRLLNPRRREQRAAARMREEPARDKYPGAVDAEFKELDDK
jgi:hypothetical protein